MKYSEKKREHIDALQHMVVIKRLFYKMILIM